jgi:hypothetical protein
MAVHRETDSEPEWFDPVRSDRPLTTRQIAAA